MMQKTKYFFKRLYDKFIEDYTLGNAAQVAFYFSFSLFPLLLFLINVFGLVLESADDFRRELFLYLRQIMPASAYELVSQTISEVMEKSSGSKVTLGLLIALWSASAGMDSLRGALNEVYGLKETRAYWVTKPLSIGLTLILGTLVFVALGIVFYGPNSIIWLLDLVNLPEPHPFVAALLRWLTIIIVLLLAFSIIYSFTPNHKRSGWRFITPGAITGIVLGSLASRAFGVYLQYFDTYSRTYGSLGAMIILMFWLYLMAVVILLGGAINLIMHEIKEKKYIVGNEPSEKDCESDDSKTPDSEKPKTEIAVIKNPIELPVISPKPAINRLNYRRSEGEKNIIGMTVAGVFGLLMGLLLKKKIDK